MFLYIYKYQWNKGQFTMASLEEENFARMSLLLTGVSPRAARILFDSAFAPVCLGATIKKEYNTLFDLKKKHLLNQSQWNLLFPRFPGKYRYVLKISCSTIPSKYTTKPCCIYYSKTKIRLLRYLSA